MSTTLTFTPEAVRDVLLAAGFTEHDPFADTAGFHVADGRDQWDCILVEHRISGERRLGDGLYQAARVHAYQAALRENGFQAHAERGQVLVTGLHGED